MDVEVLIYCLLVVHASYNSAEVLCYGVGYQLSVGSSVYKVNGVSYTDCIYYIGEYSRGRRNIMNHTNQNLNDPEYARIVEFQKIVGIRRAELVKLTGDCLAYDESGYPCILVKNGKGRKVQLQRLNKPEDVEIIKSYFEGKASNELIFSDKELNNDLNLHKLRALSAQEFYNINLQRLMNNPEYEDQMLEEIQKRWERFNINKATGKPKPFDITKFKGKWYATRGTIRKSAIENKKAIRYQKTCALYTSMMKLSHFRLNVCIENYLIV